MCNGPAIFQRLMNILLAGIQWHYCLDDIIVLGQSFDEHIQNLAQVFQHLCVANLKLQILCHVVSSAGVMIDPEKVEVSQWPVPAHLREVQQFLDLINHYQ